MLKYAFNKIVGTIIALVAFGLYNLYKESTNIDNLPRYERHNYITETKSTSFDGGKSTTYQFIPQYKNNKNPLPCLDKSDESQFIKDLNHTLKNLKLPTVSGTKKVKTTSRNTTAYYWENYQYMSNSNCTLMVEEVRERDKNGRRYNAIYLIGIIELYQ